MFIFLKNLNPKRVQNPQKERLLGKLSKRGGCLLPQKYRPDLLPDWFYTSQTVLEYNTFKMTLDPTVLI
jgi:hypothetical protein